jgi:hypothetical protein
MSKASVRLAREHREEAALLRQIHEQEKREHGRVQTPMNIPMQPAFQPGPVPCNPVAAMGVATRRTLTVLQGKGMDAAEVIQMEQQRRQYLLHLQQQAALAMSNGRPLDKAMAKELQIGLSAEECQYRLALQQCGDDAEVGQQNDGPLQATLVHCVVMEEELHRGLQEQEELRWLQEHGRISPPS